MYFSLVPLSLNCWFSLLCFCVFCFSIFIFKWNKCKNHWETPVKMREGLFVLVFAVFCNGCEPSRILIVRGFCVFYLHFFVLMFCLQVNVPQRSITHLRKCTWTLLPHPTPPQRRNPSPSGIYIYMYICICIYIYIILFYVFNLYSCLKFWWRQLMIFLCTQYPYMFMLHRCLWPYIYIIIYILYIYILSITTVSLHEPCVPHQILENPLCD